MLAAAAYAWPVSARAVLPLPTDDQLAFDVLRNGDKIGRHVVSFQPGANQLTVSIAVDLSVGIGPIKFFRYTHRAVEIWQGDDPLQIDTKTNDDGTPHFMTARRAPDGFHVAGDRTSPYIAPADVLPGSHWNRRMLLGPALINTQDGRLTHIHVADRGASSIGGVAATRYSITGGLTLDTFYAGERWVGLDFMRDGSRIQYRQTR